MTLHHPGGPDIIIKVLVNERLEVRGERRCYAAGLERQQEATSPGM